MFLRRPVCDVRCCSLVVMGRAVWFGDGVVSACLLTNCSVDASGLARISTGLRRAPRPGIY